MISTEAKKRRQFFVLVGLFLAAGGVWKSLHNHVPAGSRLIAASVVLFLIEFTAPLVAAQLFKAWMKFAHLLGAVNTRILITIVYFVVITPLSFFVRIFSKPSPYSEKEYRKRNSAWVAVPPVNAGSAPYETSY